MGSRVRRLTFHSSRTEDCTADDADFTDIYICFTRSESTSVKSAVNNSLIYESLSTIFLSCLPAIALASAGAFGRPRFALVVAILLFIINPQSNIRIPQLIVWLFLPHTALPLFTDCFPDFPILL